MERAPPAAPPEAGPAPSRRPSPWPLILALLAAIAIFVAAFLPLLLANAFACSGDGGVPYAARDSVVGRLCEARERHGLAWVQLGAVLLGAVLLLAGGTRGIFGRSAKAVAWWFALAMALLGLGMLPFVMLPTRCSDEQEAAYERWVEDRSPAKPTEPPAGCEHY